MNNETSWKLNEANAVLMLRTKTLKKDEGHVRTTYYFVKRGVYILQVLGKTRRYTGYPLSPSPPPSSSLNYLDVSPI